MLKPFQTPTSKMPILNTDKKTASAVSFFYPALRIKNKLLQQQLHVEKCRISVTHVLLILNKHLVRMLQVRK